jgi:predicted nucleic acid-binding protein
LVFLDSNLFIIDRFFRRDRAYGATHAFLEHLTEIAGVVPLLTLLELCGAASFRLTSKEAERWLHDFAAVYGVRILNPFGAADATATAWIGTLADDLSQYIGRRMTFGDALLAREADRYAAEAIVTWNIRDFTGRTAVPLRTPETFFARR